MDGVTEVPKPKPHPTAAHFRAAANCRSLRLRRGWTQRELAARAGVDHTTVCHVEKVRYRPRCDTVIDIARALGVPFWRMLAF